MAVHDYHEQLPGFDERQILHDGCSECQYRGENVIRAIGALDHNRFERAWRRAASWNRGGSGGMAISEAEAPLLNTLWAIQCQLERRGLPIGELPPLSLAGVE
jgi:hypothetical protein